MNTIDLAQVGKKLNDVEAVFEKICQRRDDWFSRFHDLLNENVFFEGDGGEGHDLVPTIDLDGDDGANAAENSASREPVARQRFPDDIFLSALNGEWQGASELYQKLAHHGLSQALIYGRYAKLLKAGIVEGRELPKRWRLKSGYLPDKTPERTDHAPMIKPNLDENGVQLFHADCFDVMPSIPDGSVDLIIADLPYGICSSNDFDKPVNIGKIFAEYRRVLKATGTVVATSSGGFTAKLIAEGGDIFKYNRVWEKTKPTGHQSVKDRPLVAHEDILIFSKGAAISEKRTKRRMTYNPQGLVFAGRKGVKKCVARHIDHANTNVGDMYEAFTNYPTTILRYAKDGSQHVFQKPVALIEELIRTYSNPGELVLDCTMGSGTTMVAAAKAGRRAIGMEKLKRFYEIAERRVSELEI